MTTLMEHACFCCVLLLANCGIASANGPCRIMVTDGLLGDGDKKPWMLRQESLIVAASQITPTCKTIYFPAGNYDLGHTPIELDFAKVFNDTAKESVFKIGVRFVGENFASSLNVGHQTGFKKPAFSIRWSRQPGQAQNAAFYWEFSGLSFIGESDNDLVSLGNPHDPDEVPFNSCIFDLVINNGHVVNESPTSARGDAVGIRIVRALQSRLNLVAACAQGTAAYFQVMEFSTVAGSFSNADQLDPQAKSGHRVTTNGLGIYLEQCSSNTFLALNCEVAFSCIQLESSSYGNVFSTMDVSNCDQRGTVIIPECNVLSGQGSMNVMKFLNVRGSRQGAGDGTTPATYANTTKSNKECFAIQNVVFPVNPHKRRDLVI